MLLSLSLLVASASLALPPEPPQQTAVLAGLEVNQSNWLCTVLSADDVVIVAHGENTEASMQVLGQLLDWVLYTPGNLVNLGDIIDQSVNGPPSTMFEACRKAAIEGCGAGLVKDFEWSDSPPICKYHCKDAPTPKAGADQAN